MGKLTIEDYQKLIDDPSVPEDEKEFARGKLAKLKEIATSTTPKFFAPKFVVMVCRGEIEKGKTPDDSQMRLYSNFKMSSGKPHDTLKQAENEIQTSKSEDEDYEKCIYRIDTFFVAKND